MADKENLGEVRLKNVRLSFANLFEPQQGIMDEATGKRGEPKYNCSFLIPKDTADGKAIMAALKKASAEVKEAKWGKNQPNLKPEKLCVRDGDLEAYDGYAGHFYVSSSNSRQPVLVDRDRSPLQKESGKLYSGCYVNAIVRIWAQDNQYGKRVNASLEAVQFLRHGEAFGAKPVDAMKAFDDETEGAENGDDELV